LREKNSLTDGEEGCAATSCTPVEKAKEGFMKKKAAAQIHFNTYYYMYCM
jgi:hypothetical protein